MPDRRRHRGRHPKDAQLFAADRVPVLREAVAELSWLLGRGYAETAALKLVGDRHALRERQRLAVLRCACSDAARDERARRRVDPSGLAGRALAVDGFNCVITTESALAGGLVLAGRDGALRDLASVHGSYRRVEETAGALAALAGVIRGASPASVTWHLDKPVSNSGRLRAMIQELDPSWRVELVNNPDRALVESDGAVVASSDAWVLDRCDAWVDLIGAAIASTDEVWRIDLGEP